MTVVCSPTATAALYATGGPAAQGHVDLICFKLDAMHAAQLAQEAAVRPRAPSHSCAPSPAPRDALARPSARCFLTPKFLSHPPDPNRQLSAPCARSQDEAERREREGAQAEEEGGAAGGHAASSDDEEGEGGADSRAARAERIRRARELGGGFGGYHPDVGPEVTAACHFPPSTISPPPAPAPSPPLAHARSGAARRLLIARPALSRPRPASRCRPRGRRRQVRLDGDTFFRINESAMAATLAAGSVIELTSRVVMGELRNALAITRPPGHHCEEANASGFCLLNNVALAARVAQERHGLRCGVPREREAR